MSTVAVKVCKIENIRKHPKADRLDIVSIKGWETCVTKNSFKLNELCIYFPPDSLLLPEVAHSPNRVCKNNNCKNFEKEIKTGNCDFCGSEAQWKDGTPGRCDVAAYCSKYEGKYRVKAKRLRGIESFGFVLKIDPVFGDDLNWKEGTDLTEYFHVTKYEPPLECQDGDADANNSLLYKYTDIENFGNFPNSLIENEEVVITEKIHGSNCAMGYIKSYSQDNWEIMVGSHNIRRKQYFEKFKSFEVDDLKDIVCKNLKINDIWEYSSNCFYKVESKTTVFDVFKIILEKRIFSLHKIIKIYKRRKVHCRECLKNGDKKLFESKYWRHLKQNVKDALVFIKDNFEFPEAKNSIIIFGEIYGAGIQDMDYGLRYGHFGFRAFDIAINGKYIDFEDKKNILEKFKIDMVPILYKGPFSLEKAKSLSSGDTMLCKPEDTKSFSQREGIVITPAKERISEDMMLSTTYGRVILKLISADFLSRKNPTDFH